MLRPNFRGDMYAKGLDKDFVAVHGLHDLYGGTVHGWERKIGGILSYGEQCRCLSGKQGFYQCNRMERAQIFKSAHFAASECTSG